MKSIHDRRPLIRKTDRKVKHSSFKQRDRLLLPSASPPSKASIAHPQSATAYVRYLFSQIQQLIEAGKFKSDELFEVVDTLKSLFTQVNNAADQNGVATDCYQALTQQDISLLCRLVSNLVSERTQSKVMGVFGELAYSPYSSLIVHSPEAVATIVRTLASTTNALRLRAVGCIANLAGEGTVRNFLIGIPEVVTGLIQNMDFECKTRDDIAAIVTARDTCWAINNIISTEPVPEFAKIQIFLDPLVNMLSRLEHSAHVDEQVHVLIRFGLRAVENALELASHENMECSLQNNPKLVHLLSWCMSYRNIEPYRDICFTALICMRHFAISSFLEEQFIKDIPTILRDLRMLRADGARFLNGWCVAITCMMKNGMSDRMMMCTVTRIVNGLHTIMKWPVSNHELRRNACHAINLLGRTIQRGDYVDAFWSACGGNGLLFALSMDGEASVNRQALFAMDNLLPNNVTATSTYLLAKPDLQKYLIDAVEKLTESEDYVTSQAAITVLTKLEQLENEENIALMTLEQANAKTVPVPKRRRVELGEFNS